MRGPGRCRYERKSRESFCLRSSSAAALILGFAHTSRSRPRKDCLARRPSACGSCSPRTWPARLRRARLARRHRAATWSDVSSAAKASPARVVLTAPVPFTRTGQFPSAADPRAPRPRSKRPRRWVPVGHLSPRRRTGRGAPLRRTATLPSPARACPHAALPTASPGRLSSSAHASNSNVRSRRGSPAKGCDMARSGWEVPRISSKVCASVLSGAAAAPPPTFPADDCIVRSTPWTPRCGGAGGSASRQARVASRTARARLSTCGRLVMSVRAFQMFGAARLATNRPGPSRNPNVKE